MTTTTDETLGAAVGAALRAGTGSVTVRPLDLGRVERGARRRRNRRRGAAAATGVVLTVAMGWALTTRSDSTEPAERAEAKKRIWSAGKFRSSRIWRMATPT